MAFPLFSDCSIAYNSKIVASFLIQVEGQLMKSIRSAQWHVQSYLSLNPIYRSYPSSAADGLFACRPQVGYCISYLKHVRYDFCHTPVYTIFLQKILGVHLYTHDLRWIRPCMIAYWKVNDASPNLKSKKLDRRGLWKTIVRCNQYRIPSKVPRSSLIYHLPIGKTFKLHDKQVLLNGFDLDFTC